MAKPDNALVDFTSRFRALEEIIEVTTKPIIVDGDAVGELAHFGYRIKTLDRLGVSAIIIEDKNGLIILLKWNYMILVLILLFMRII